MTVTTKVLEKIDIPTFFWLGSEGLEGLTEKEFQMRVKKEQRDNDWRSGESASEQDIGG